MIRAYYSAAIQEFVDEDPEHIFGILSQEHHHSLEEAQKWAWLEQIRILKNALAGSREGQLFLEFYIPRMGKRADAVLVTHNLVFVVEFKVGSSQHAQHAVNQVEDYALDLKNFHEGSHGVPIVPILVSTNAEDEPAGELKFADDGVASPLVTNGAGLRGLLDRVCAETSFPTLDLQRWMAGGYRPTPTIVQAAQTLYLTHSVADISRSDAGARNLQETSAIVSRVIDNARETHKKAICFVTGVPGSGKTLAGLNLAIRRSEGHEDEHAAFLSGNGPLVVVLREALARDKARRQRVAKRTAEREVSGFIQNIHHFRDEYVTNSATPIEKVVVFDEAQRAWNRAQAASFMQRKRGLPDFDMSEPEFLLGVMNRHEDWCAVVCLVGEGQEINTGEAGISEWLHALTEAFQDWEVYLSPRIAQPEYGSGTDVAELFSLPHVHSEPGLHLAVSMRSFRAESLSQFVGHLLDGDANAARSAYLDLHSNYPIYLTRNLRTAREWLRGRARGTERFGLVASSGAQRLRPEGIYVKADVDPANWFLNDRADVRSSCYLEDVASEFEVQGLELDWAGVCWDGDLHYDTSSRGWMCQSFKGTRWQSIKDRARQLYLRNAYRVLLTRARQGMVVFIPAGDTQDATRPPAYYDGTFEMLRSCGIPALD